MTALVSQVLSEAADLLAKPGAWTQGTYARNASGFSVAPSTEEAVCFCVRGAVRALTGETYYGRYQRAAAEFCGLNNVQRLADWNDMPVRTQEEVVDALRRAAALAKEQGR